MTTTPIEHNMPARRWTPMSAATVIVPMLAFVVAAALYLPQQSIWIDETTQLSGITLSPVEVTRWLTGTNPGRFGVVPDRAPPISYWAGIAWSRVFGLNETSLRWMGVIFVAAAVGIVARLGDRIGGAAMGWAAGLFLALSPNIVTLAVGIRSYPVFLFVSTLAFAAMLPIVRDPDGYRFRNVVFLTLALTAAIYTHFYGVVLAAAMWSGSILSVAIQRGRLKPLWIGGVLTGILALGIVPFVMQSTSASHAQETGRTIRDLVRLVYRFVGHPAMSMSTAASILALLGAGTALAISLAPRKETAAATRGIAAVLAIGFGATALAGHFVKTFAAYAPHYNCWIFPGLALMIGSAIQSRRTPLRPIALAAVGIVLFADVYALGRLAVDGAPFSNGPHRVIAATARKHASAPVLLDGEYFAFAYYPLRYEFGPDLRQYIAAPDAIDDSVTRYPPAKDQPVVHAEQLEANTLIVITIHQLSADQLKKALTGSASPIPPGPLSLALDHSQQWKRDEKQEVVGLTGATISVYSRVVDRNK